MLLSEDEAKRKWCPFGRGMVEVRTVHGEPVSASSANRTVQGVPTVGCIGTACMAWHWAGWRIKTFDTVAPNPDDKPFGAA
jgi:hypothetical protein